VFFVEARYENQVWEIELPLPRGRIEGEADLAGLVEAFHAKHEEVFAFRDAASHVECVTWIARVRCRLRDTGLGRLTLDGERGASQRSRSCYFGGHGALDTRIFSLSTMETGTEYFGPLIVETPFTTIVIDPGSSCSRTSAGSVLVTPGLGNQGSRALSQKGNLQ
jgi:N-methylhydantoinase A